MMKSENDTSERIARVKAEIQHIQAERKEERQPQARMERDMTSEIARLTSKLKKTREEIHGNLTVHKYAKVLRDDKTPNAILILQAKLCRQIHIVCVERAQLKLTTSITKELSSHGQKQVAKVIQDRNLVEMELLNQMAKLQHEEKDFQDSCQQRIRTQSFEIATLHKELSDRSVATDNGQECALDGILDRISELNTKLQDQKNGKLNDPTELPTKQGSFRKDKPPLSRFEMRTRAMQQRAISDTSPRLAKSLSDLSSSIRNIVTDLST